MQANILCTAAQSTYYICCFRRVCVVLIRLYMYHIRNIANLTLLHESVCVKVCMCMRFFAVRVQCQNVYYDLCRVCGVSGVISQIIARIYRSDYKLS